MAKRTGGRRSNKSETERPDVDAKSEAEPARDQGNAGATDAAADTGRAAAQAVATATAEAGGASRTVADSALDELADVAESAADIEVGVETAPGGGSASIRTSGITHTASSGVAIEDGDVVQSTGVEATVGETTLASAEAEIRLDVGPDGSQAREVNATVAQGNVEQTVATGAALDEDGVEVSAGAETRVGGNTAWSAEARAEAGTEGVSAGVYQQGPTGATQDFVEAKYDRQTTTDGDSSSDATTVGGGARVGGAEVSAQRTESRETTATTETDTLSAEAEVAVGGASAEGSVTFTERTFDTDESETGNDLADTFLSPLLGNEDRPDDYENTVEAEGRVGDTEVSARFTDGKDLDGNRGEGWSGNEFGADYTEREWSSQEVRVGDHVVAQDREVSKTVDNNPFDGDLENSATYRESVRVDDHSAEVRIESTERSDINPFDGDLSQESSSYRGVTVDGTEVSQSRSDQVSVDTDPRDGSIGVSGESSERIVIGDNEVSRSSQSEAGIDVDGSASAQAEGSLDADVLGRTGEAAGHAEARLGPDTGVDVGGSVNVDGVGQVDGDAEVYAGDSVGASGGATLLGVTVTGSVDSSAGVQVGVESDADAPAGDASSPGELVDDGLEGLGDAAEDLGEAADEGLDNLGDAAEDAGEAISDFLSGDDDDEGDDDDGGSVGDAIDDFFGWG